MGFFVEDKEFKTEDIDTKSNKEIKDDYHTLEELYEHRTLLFALICSKLFPQDSWKSKKHSDGTSELGWFIAGIESEYGQITYHQKIEYWDNFQCKILDKAPDYDGHTSEDVLRRLLFLIYN